MIRVCLTVVVALAAGNAQNPPTIAELAGLKRFSSIQVSPTSDDVAFIIEQPGEPTAIWLAPAQGPAKKLLSLRGGTSSLSWFPDGVSVGYIEDGRLFRLKLPNGRPEAIRTTLARVASWQAHPDGKRVVVIGPRGPANNSDPITVGDLEPVDRVAFSTALVVNLDGTNERTVGSEHSMMARWSSDGHRLAIVSAEKPYVDWTQLQPRIRIWDEQTGKIVNACATAGKLTTPEWSPDGQQVAFIGSGDDGSDFYPSSLWVCDLKTAAKKDLAKNCDWTVESIRWGPTGIQWVGATGGQRFLMSMRSGCKGTEQRLPGLVDFRTDWNINKSGTVALSVSTPSHPPELVRVRAGAPAEPLFTPDEALLTRAFPKASEVSWTSKDRMRISGVLFLPANHTPGKALKTVIHLHGGNVGEALDFQGSAMHWGQLLAGSGFAVLMVNYRGSPVSGERFHRVWRGELGDKDVEDILAGAEYLIKIGIADRKALAVSGISYGAYLGGMVISRSSLFQSAVLVSGVYNYWTLHTGQTAAPKSAAVLEWGRNPFEIPDVIHQRSPVTYVNSISARTLLVCGKMDPAIPYTQSVEFFRGLRSFGKDAALVAYPTEGHLMGARENVSDLFERAVAWLSRTTD